MGQRRIFATGNSRLRTSRMEKQDKLSKSKKKNKQKKDNDIVQKPTQELENLQAKVLRLEQELEKEKAEKQRLANENEELKKYIAELERRP